MSRRGGREDGRVRVLAAAVHLVGGIRTYLKYVYRHLAAEGFDLTILTLQSDEAEALRGDLAACGVNVRELKPGDGMLRLAAAIRRECRMHAPDVIHAQGFTAAVASAVGTARRSTPVMVTSHDVIEAHPLQERFTIARRVALRWALSRAAIVQSVSHDAQENLVDALPSLRSHPGLRVIMNGVQAAAFSPARGDGATSRAGPARFVFVGRPMPQKGFVDIIEACGSLVGRHDFAVTVCSDGGFIREYRAEIRRRGLDHLFRFRGFLPVVAEELHAADAQLMPSLWEACPLAPMEALIAGCPLIATSCIGLREVVAGSPALVVPPGAPAALASAMERVILEREALKAAALEYAPIASERFDVRHTSAALGRLLAEVAGRAHGA